MSELSLTPVALQNVAGQGHDSISGTHRVTKQARNLQFSMSHPITSAVPKILTEAKAATVAAGTHKQPVTSSRAIKGMK